VVSSCLCYGILDPSVAGKRKIGVGLGLAG
jgi:hypothetical protein